MNKKELVRRITAYMRDKNIRKPVSVPKQVLHISDDEGNQKDFVVRKANKSVIFTSDDVEAIVNAFIEEIQEAMKNGEEVSLHGFGTFGLKYRQPRKTKKPGTDDWVDVAARFVPKFSFGNEMRRCAKIYELSLNDKIGISHAILEEIDSKERE